MNNEPRLHSDYSPRQTEAAKRVLIDLGQTLAAFRDCLVVIGGWVPDLLLADAQPRHVGSIDVDLVHVLQTLLPARMDLKVGHARAHCFQGFNRFFGCSLNGSRFGRTSQPYPSANRL